jgi:hypothetical protein
LSIVIIQVTLISLQPLLQEITQMLITVNNGVIITMIINHLGVYNNDRLYGLRQLPKRPWEMFKDPENTMKRVAYKHNRDNSNY